MKHNPPTIAWRLTSHSKGTTDRQGFAPFRISMLDGSSKNEDLKLLDREFSSEADLLVYTTRDGNLVYLPCKKQ